ncbi:hypothetical protein J007_05846 [Cryptococcus neoformans]|nr:hypothetical protein J007_05847 [Cryptococcus neoformans var. grubii]OXB34471.1 hypothetical protein J007_05846 [Cryptococcus neoformans var. grubii]OXC58592.1 hypothetical protein C358_05965 [Cryptococcus neoformans var. grubii MW-RSA852]
MKESLEILRIGSGGKARAFLEWMIIVSSGIQTITPVVD